MTDERAASTKYKIVLLSPEEVVGSTRYRIETPIRVLLHLLTQQGIPLFPPSAIQILNRGSGKPVRTFKYPFAHEMQASFNIHGSELLADCQRMNVNDFERKHLR